MGLKVVHHLTLIINENFRATEKRFRINICKVKTKHSNYIVDKSYLFVNGKKSASLKKIELWTFQLNFALNKISNLQNIKISIFL